MEIDRDGLYDHGVLSAGIGWQVPRLPGLGEIRWDRFISALYRAGYDYAVVVEHEDRGFEGSDEKIKAGFRHRPRRRRPLHRVMQTSARADHPAPRGRSGDDPHRQAPAAPTARRPAGGLRGRRRGAARRGRHGRRRARRRRHGRPRRRVRRHRRRHRPSRADAGDPPARVRRRARHVRAQPRPRRGTTSWWPTSTATTSSARYRGPADQLFSALSSARPQIYGVYWSRPQIAARQHERMVTVRRFLNSFWSHESDGQQWFDPDRDIGYPDRIRRRQPSTPSLGLSPHADSGSIERWLLPAYQARLPPRVRRRVGALRPVGRRPPRRDPRVPDDGDVLGVPHVPGLDGAVGDAPRRRRAARHPDPQGDGLPPAAGTAGRHRRRRPVRRRQRPCARRHRALPRRCFPALRPDPRRRAGRHGVVARRPHPRRRRRDQRRAVGQRDVHPGGAVVRQERRLRAAVRRGVPRRAQSRRLRRRGLRGRLGEPRRAGRPQRDRPPAARPRRRPDVLGGLRFIGRFPDANVITSTKDSGGSRMADESTSGFPRFGLDGRTALVTGAARGIGRTIALAARRRRCRRRSRPA